MNWRILLFILIAIVISSCKSTKTTTEFPMGKRLTSIENMQFVAKINPRFPDFSQPFSARLKIANFDSLSMTATGPFGMAVGRLYADANNFIFHNIFENTIYQGKPNSENLSKAANLNLSFIDLLSLLRGEPPGDFSEFRLFNKKDEQLIYIRTKGNEFAEFVVISEKNNKLLQYQRKNQNDEVELNVFFSDFKRIDGIDIANKITLDFPIINGKMEIELENIELNKQLAGEFRFSIPNSAKLINLE